MLLDIYNPMEDLTLSPHWLYHPPPPPLIPIFSNMVAANTR